MITLRTPVLEYLDLCEERGANADGECPSFAWARAMFQNGERMTEALNALEGTSVGLESAMFAFEYMLHDISTAVRWRFARVIAADPSPVIHALNWRRLVAAHKEGAPAPTETEDEILRRSWHSRWQGKSALPEWEREE